MVGNLLEAIRCPNVLILSFGLRLVRPHPLGGLVKLHSANYETPGIVGAVKLGLD